MFTGAFRVFAAELPLAKSAKETASTPAVANQVFGDPTAEVSAPRRYALTGWPTLKEGRRRHPIQGDLRAADRNLVGSRDAAFLDEHSR